MHYQSLLVAALAGTALAQTRPSNTSICDFYTTALLKDNTAENQATILTLLVNTAVIGNYTKPQIQGVTFPDIAVPGILADGEVNGQTVSLLSYFNGSLLSTNRGGNTGVSVNFLDDGGAEPLKNNKPADGTQSNQYKLLTHLYEFFGTLLGCSQQGMKGFDNYDGAASMYDVHKYMVLSEAQTTYFNTQVGLSAASFGVSDDDVKAVGTNLNNVFGYKCSPPAQVIKQQGPQLQSICTGDGCPQSNQASDTCPASLPQPSKASSTDQTASSASSTQNGSKPTSTGAASPISANFGLLGLGLVGLLL